MGVCYKHSVKLMHKYNCHVYMSSLWPPLQFNCWLYCEALIGSSLSYGMLMQKQSSLSAISHATHLSQIELKFFWTFSFSWLSVQQASPIDAVCAVWEPKSAWFALIFRSNSTIANQVLLASTSSNIRPGSGSVKTFNECLGLSNVGSSAA